jgi:hypothetical protein
VEWNYNQKKKSEKMAFLRKDPVRCKIVVDKKCLEQVKDFEYLGCEICSENGEMYSTKSIKIWSNTGNCKQHI